MPIYAVTLPGFCSLPTPGHLAASELLCFSASLSPSWPRGTRFHPSVPQPRSLSHQMAPWGRVSLHHLSSSVFRSKLEVLPTLRKRGLYQVWTLGHTKVCLSCTPRKSHFRHLEPKWGEEWWDRDWRFTAGQWVGEVRKALGWPRRKPFEVPLFSSPLLHRHRAFCPMSVAKGQFRHRGVTSEASQVAQWWRICLPMQETRVQPLG